MAVNRKRPLRGNAPKALVEPPLFIRLCQSFVDHLGVILKTAFVFGAIVLVEDLLTGLEETREAPPRSVQILEPDQLAPAVPGPGGSGAADDVATETFMSDGVRHALNCTYTEYRNEHYDECVDDDSEVYRHPPADSDDRGFVARDALILLADTKVFSEPREL